MHESLLIALLQAREVVLGYFRPTLKAHQLTEQQWRIIRILAKTPSLDFHLLAQKSCILRPSLTGILTRMEKAGIIHRLKPLSDQRKLYLSLTDEGTALYHRVQAEVETGYQALELQFTPEKVRQLYALLDDLVALPQRDGGEEKE